MPSNCGAALETRIKDHKLDVRQPQRFDRFPNQHRVHLLTALVYCNSWPDVPLPTGYTGFAASGPYELQKSPSPSEILARLHMNTMNVNKTVYFLIANNYQLSIIKIILVIKPIQYDFEVSK